MLNYVKNSFECGYVKSLNFLTLEETVSIETGEGRINLTKRLPQQSEQIVTRDNVAARKFGIAIPSISFGAQPSYYPLPGVTTEVQKQIPDAV